MRKIVSKQKEKKKQKRNQYILGAILIFVMFGSVFGIVATSFGKDKSEDKINYNGYEFQFQNNYWITQIGNNNFFFLYSPLEMNNSAELNLLTNYIQKPFYLSSDDYTASTEIYQNLDRLVERIQFACLDEEDCEDNLPLKTCEDNFVIIRESNESRISQEENCVFIEGKAEDLVILTDEFLYKITGIKQ